MKISCPHVNLYQKKVCRHANRPSLDNMKWETETCKTCSERYSSNFEKVVE